MNERAYREAEQKWWMSVGAQPEERMVRLPRLDVPVRIQEVGEGEPVLYLHGGPNAGSTWAPVVARTPGLRSLMIDRPGTGLSEQLPISPDNLGEVADNFVADVLDALELRRVHIVASSFGGFLALRSAAATPDRVDRMVQMACPAGAPGMAVPPFMRVMALPGMARLMASLPPSEKAARSVLRQIGHEHSLDRELIPEGFLEWYVNLLRYTDTMRNDGRGISKLASVAGRWHPAMSLPDDVLTRVSAPTYFLWGADDTFGGEEVARRLVDAMPDARLEMMPNGGHLPWLDNAEHAAQKIVDFLREQAREYRDTHDWRHHWREGL